LAGAARTLDFGQPVALMLLAILQFIPTSRTRWGWCPAWFAGLPPGSYLVISHPTDDFNPNRASRSSGTTSGRRPGHAPGRGRDHRFFAGLDLVEPGVVAVAKWRPDSEHLASMPLDVVRVARKG